MSVTTACAKIRDVLDSFRCGELLVETNHEVLAHLRTCRACAAELERRQQIVALLQSGREIPADVAAIARRIDGAIAAEQRWWTRAVRLWPLAAAALLVTAIVAWRLATPVRVDAAAYRDSVGDHIECALTMPAGVAYDPARVSRRLPPEFATLAESLRRLPGVYRLVDAHGCPYRERRYVHFVFRDRDRTLSLFVDDRSRGALPRAGEPVDLSPYRVTGTETSGHQLLVVSDATASAGGELAAAVFAPALEFFRARGQ